MHGTPRPGADRPAASADPSMDPEAAFRAAEGDREANAEPVPGAVPPDLLEALRQIAGAGRAGLGASGRTVKALQRLVVADLGLARAAGARAAAYGGIAVIFGGSAWLLLMAALITFLARVLDWPWWVALLLSAGISLAIAGVGVVKAVQYFDHTRLKATRRQLARLGFGELADFTPTPGSPMAARDAVQTPESGGRPMKDEHGVDLTPP